MTNIIHTPDSQKYPKLSGLEVLSVMGSIVRRCYTLGKSTDPVSARALATTLSHEVMDILMKKGIDIQLHGFEQDLSQVGLYLGNHQAFGLEAFFANSFIAPDTRIVLKDDLISVPITGKAMESVDPIVFQRPSKYLDKKAKRLANLCSLQRINVEQQDTLKQGGSVLIFPEGTRQKNSSDILPTQTLLFQPSYSLMVDANSPIKKRQICVITADTFRTFPFTPEEWKKYGTGTKHPIKFWFDILDTHSEETIADFSQRVTSIMKGHLRDSGAIA